MDHIFSDPYVFENVIFYLHAMCVGIQFSDNSEFAQDSMHMPPLSFGNTG